jgi:hypothetical protein
MEEENIIEKYDLNKVPEVINEDSPNVKPKRIYRKKVKPEDDKRKQTSKANMEKARMARIEKIKTRKENESRKEAEEKTYEIDTDSESESESSESDEEVLFIGKKKKPKRVLNKKTMKKQNKENVEPNFDAKQSIDELKELINNLTQKKPKKQQRKKQIIKIVNPQQTQPNNTPSYTVQSDPDMELYKKMLLTHFP